MVQKLFAKPFWCTFYNVLKRTKHRLRETQTDRQTEVSLKLVPRVKQGIAPGAARRYAPHRRLQFDGGKNRGGSTSVRGRIRSPHISGGRRAYSLGSCAVGLTAGRTDRSTDHAIPKCPVGRGRGITIVR